MEFKSNSGKNVEIIAGGQTYLRHAIRTKFITSNDNYIEIVKICIRNV